MVIVRRLRHEKRWSQEQLAELAGLNVRTIQRIEAGGNASAESLKCLASVLEVNVSRLEETIKVIDKTTEDWQKVPSWLRAYFYGSSVLRIPERKLNIRAEQLLVIAGLAILALSPFIDKPLEASFAVFSGAYFVSLFTRAGDKYSIW